jgi:hypothetical protein
MREGFVGLGHLKSVVALFDSGTLVVGGRNKLCGQLFGHRLTLGVACGDEYPAKRERLLALRAYLARHLVVGTANAARADLHRRSHIADSGLKKLNRILNLCFFLYQIKRIVHHLARGALFAVPHDRVNKLLYAERVVFEVCTGDIPIFNRASHSIFLLFLFSCSTGVLFNAIAAAGYIALVDAGCIELAAHHLVAHVDVFNAAGAHQDHRVLLEVVALARDIGGYLHAVGEAHAGDFADSGVRLAGGFGSYLGTNAALKRRWIKYRAIFKQVKAAAERRRLCFALHLGASFADQL